MKTLPCEKLLGIDIITAGFRCQDIARAGGQAGFSGKRSSLFREVVRVATAAAVPFLYLENVGSKYAWYI